MTLTNYIQELQKIEARGDGDKEVAVSVRDYYSKYGSPATTKIDADASMGGGYFVNSEWVVITANLSTDYEDRNPKITFRK